jgi:putative ABC transport system permease protein
MPVAIVNETFAERYLAGEDPLTRRILLQPRRPLPSAPAPAPVEWQIVGVSAAVRNLGPANQDVPEITLPLWQAPLPYVQYAVRTAGEPTAVQQAIAAIVESVDPDLPLADVKTMDQLVSQRLVRDRFNTTLFGSFAAVGLVLAALGIYGVMSFLVAQRTRDIGLRIALGAQASRIIGEIVGEGMITAAIGAACGSIGAFYVVRAMRGLVTGVSDLHLGAFAAVIVVLLAAALASCLVPALRAARLDPIAALRQD